MNNSDVKSDRAMYGDYLNLGDSVGCIDGSK